MMMVQACISEQQLREYLLGRLSEQESEQLEAHLRQCAACEETAANLEAEDTLAEQLRCVSLQSLPPEDDDWQDQRVAASAERIKRMVPVVHRASAGGADFDGAADASFSGTNLEQTSRDDADAAGPLGSYELLERIGRGGMGAVYRGRHRRLDRLVAIKLLPSRFAKDPDAIARFQREMRAVGSLHHPAIITATDAGEHRGTHYLVMELVDGLDLAQIARALGPLPVREACELVRQAALGLEYVHAQGIVHRDIKPSNLMLDRQGRVKILDLGLAQLGPWTQPVDEYTTVGQLMGTLDYMAPEQSESGQRTDYRSDLYSLGATLYRLLCGRAPYAVTPYLSPLEKLRLLASSEPPRLATLRPDAPPELCKLVDQLLARVPDQRPAGAALVAQRLEPLSAGAAIASLLDQARERLADEPAEEDEPHQDSPAPQPASPSAGGGRRRGWNSLVAIAALLPLLIFGGILVVLETEKGQIVIESDAADVQVRLIRDGEPVEEVAIEHGTTATRVRAGNYEVVIDQPSDALVISGNTFTLRRGETVVTRITRRSPEERVAMQSQPQPTPLPVSPEPTYGGKNLDDWLAILQRERARDELTPALEAIDALADSQSAQKISEVALHAARQLPGDLDVSLFLLARKHLQPQAALEAALEQLAINDPVWQQRVLQNLFALISTYPVPLDRLVERVAELALDQEHPEVSAAALRRLPELAVMQHRQGESVERTVAALQRALQVAPKIEAFFAEKVVDSAWPESLQRVYLRWSLDHFKTPDKVNEDTLVYALLNISANNPLALEMFPDLPQQIVNHLDHRLDPLPTSDDRRPLTAPFAKQAIAVIAEALRIQDPRLELPSRRSGPSARVSPVLLLASLAVHPALRTEDGVRVLEQWSDQLPADAFKSLPRPFPSLLVEPDGVPENAARLLMVLALSSEQGGGEPGRLLPLYLISRRAVEEAEAEAEPAATEDEQLPAADPAAVGD